IAKYCAIIGVASGDSCGFGCFAILPIASDGNTGEDCRNTLL
ncbi:uncharacterized protein METZ01_LOCUS296341, partial [marine metagenome]